jgi:hypothetical protein
MALGVENFMSDDPDFRDLLADVPRDSAPEPPVRQGRQIKALAAHDRADPSGNTRCAVSLPKDAQYSECNKRLKG